MWVTSRPIVVVLGGGHPTLDRWIVLVYLQVRDGAQVQVLRCKSLPGRRRALTVSNMYTCTMQHVHMVN